VRGLASFLPPSGGRGYPLPESMPWLFLPMARFTPSPDEAPIHRLRGEQWEPLSPLKATALTLLPHPSHPFTLLAGTAGQGIWKTEDGGLSWHNVSGKSGARHVYALAANPSKPYEFFAGAKEGLFLSKDGGETWEKFPSPFSVPHCSPLFFQRLFIRRRARSKPCARPLWRLQEPGWGKFVGEA